MNEVGAARRGSSRGRGVAGGRREDFEGGRGLGPPPASKGLKGLRDEVAAERRDRSRGREGADRVRA